MDARILTLEKNYQQQIDDLPNARAKFLGWAALAWLIPVAALYALGYAVAWVRRGFRIDSYRAHHNF